MSEQDVCEFLEKVEAVYTRRLVRAWELDPESFDDYVGQLENVIDLRAKSAKLNAGPGRHRAK
jgi:hypothetical protein